MGKALAPFIDGMTFTECPRWHDGRLWFSDFYTYAVYAADPAGKVSKIVEVPGRPGGLGWLPDGRLLVVSSNDRLLLRQEPDGTLVKHADLAKFFGGPGNDMIVDRSGTAFVGNMGFEVFAGADFAPAPLVRVDPDGSARIATGELYFSNGCAITSDGKTLIVAESLGNRLSQFAISSSGGLGERRDWARYGDLPSATGLVDMIAEAAIGADGIAIDSEDAIWIADAYHHRVVRMREGGEIVEEIATGDDQAYAVALGGQDGRTLFVCMAPNFYEHERSVTRQGRIMTAVVDVPASR